jgi:hypothetical protein
MKPHGACGVGTDVSYGHSGSRYDCSRCVCNFPSNRSERLCGCYKGRAREKNQRQNSSHFFAPYQTVLPVQNGRTEHGRRGYQNPLRCAKGTVRGFAALPAPSGHRGGGKQSALLPRRGHRCQRRRSRRDWQRAQRAELRPPSVGFAHMSAGNEYRQCADARCHTRRSPPPSRLQAGGANWPYATSSAATERIYPRQLARAA